MSTALVLFAACETPPVAKPEAPPEPERNGSTLLLDFSPTNRPMLVGAYDFTLLAGGVGKACVDRRTTTQVFWVGMNDLVKLSRDHLTQQAIAAAAFDAISRLEDADSIVVTRVVTEATNGDKMCASVYGRGIKLIKASRSAGVDVEQSEAMKPVVK